MHKSMIMDPDAAADQIAPATTDFETILSAWQAATDKLQQTHESLRHEVKRLSDELEFKNQELARKNRLADLGQMAAHVAHEVRNALVPLTLYLSLLKRKLPDNDELQQIVNRIEAGFADAQNTVTDLLQFTTEKDVDRRRVNVRSMVEEVCDGLAPQLDAQNVNARLDVAPTIRVSADKDMLRRAILNLVLNAVDVMPTGGDLVVTACPQGHLLEIEVADSGPGVAETTKRQVFDPFFTTKRDGTGLGLAIVQRIAEAHGGEVDVINCPEGGAAFTMSIPSQPSQHAA